MSKNVDLMPSGGRPQRSRALDRPESGTDILLRQSHGYGYGSEEETEEGIRIWDYLRAVRKHIWLVVGLTVILTSLGAVYLARLPNIYEGKARVQVDAEGAGPAMGALKNASVVVNNSANDPAYFNTQLQLLSSPVLLGRVVKTLDLENSEIFFQGQAARDHSTWQTILEMFRIKKDERVEKYLAQEGSESLRPDSVAPPLSRTDLYEAERMVPFVKALQGGIEIEPVQETRVPVKETRLIDISFKHADPRLAAQIANAIAETFVLSNLERKNETNVASGDFLQKRIAELQAKIRQGEEGLVAYAKTHQILSLDGQQNTVVERLAGLNRQLLEAENERKLAEGAFLVGGQPAAAAALADSNAREATDAEVKLSDLRQKREQLLLDFKEKSPEVTEVDKQIGVLEAFVKDSRARATKVMVTNLDTRYRQALAREQSLRAAFEQQKSETITQNEAAINYRIQEQELATYKDLLNGLLQRAKENDVMLAGTSNNVHVDSFALLPRDAVAPRRLRIVAVIFLLALGLGAGLAVFLDFLDDTVHSSEEAERVLRLPALAVIPILNGASSGRWLRALAPGRQASRSVDSETPLIHRMKASALAESYRQLRTSVLLSTAGHAPKTLLITSSEAAEGKTTTAVNVAISLAQTGARVLIIDGDMRRPRLHSIFDLPNEHGLSQCLSTEMNMEDVTSCISADEDSGLHILTSGPLPPNPAELLGSVQMRTLLSELQDHFTHIVLDSPPIASVTDAVLISTIVDGVLLVVQYGRCSKQTLRRSRNILHQVGARVVGVVLNKVDEARNEYRYWGYYGTATDSVGDEAKQIAGG